MRSYPVKENHIGSAVSEILRYRQTDILHTDKDPVTWYKFPFRTLLESKKKNINIQLFVQTRIRKIWKNKTGVKNTIFFPAIYKYKMNVHLLDNYVIVKDSLQLATRY